MAKFEIQDTPDDHLRRVAGKHGIEVPNDRGERLLQFCFEENFTITNNTIENWEKGLSIGGRRLSNFFFEVSNKAEKWHRRNLKLS